MTEAVPELSLVLPAFNEERGIAGAVARVREEATRLGRSFEILVVDDGSRDATARIAEGAVGPGGRVLRLPRNRGKGAAVREGLLGARGRYRLFMDADLSVEPREVGRVLRELESGAAVAVASRRLPESRLLRRQPRLREHLGTVYRTAATWMLLPGLSDLTCGLKGFTGAAVEAIFPRCRIDGFGFDVEVLYVARHLGLPVREIAVEWRDDPDTRVRLLRDALGSFAELLAVPVNAWLGRYGPRQG